ncbi:MAG: ATP-binding cassette domain-containing protein [Flavobacteriales bacterium]|nr:ATP-binding cassette domain-containing protein [Flavobacteriales bacterium]
MLKFELHKAYKAKKRVVKISCSGELKEGITTAFYGQSGVGKSTVLRMICGLDIPDSGRIVFNDDVWFDGAKNLNIKQRRIGYVFQDFNLFPNMKILKNLKYASPNGEVKAEIFELLKKTALDSLLESYPDDLSGGERQRIAVIRALCQSPEILLLDEPFSALDDDSIRLLINEISEIQQLRPMTVGVISHRKDVIFEMAEEMIYMKTDGTSEQGTPKQLISAGI